MQVNSNAEHHGQEKDKNEKEADVRVTQSGASFERRRKPRAKALFEDNLRSFRTARHISFCSKGRGPRRKVHCFLCVGFHLSDLIVRNLSRGGAEIPAP